MPPFGVSAHLVADLRGGDGGGAAVDQGGQLLEADDSEELAQQAGAVGDGALEAVASAVIGHQPDHQGKDAAVAGLGMVFLVAPAGGNDAARVLGSAIDLNEVAILIGRAGDGHGQVRAQHLRLAAGAKTRAPALRL